MWAQWGDHFYCTVCVPIARDRCPVDADMLWNGRGFVGRFQDRRNFARHAGTHTQAAGEEPHIENVFWNPANPNLSVLRKEAERQDFNQPALGGKTFVCGCASCGCVFMNPEAHTTHSRLVHAAFSADSPFPPESSRGIRDHGFELCLIKCLVPPAIRGTRRFFLCDSCHACVIHRDGPRRPPNCDLDLGDVSSLPQPTAAEKAAIAKVRIYGCVIKLFVGDAMATKISGHCISFPQEGASLEAAVFPRADIADNIRVQFIGGLTDWSGAIPLLSGTNSFGHLTLRRDVVCKWLEFLKKTHPQYADVVLDFSEDRWSSVLAAQQTILDAAVISADEATRVVDEAARDDVAADVGQVGVPVGNGGIQISDACVGSNAPDYNEAARRKDVLDFLKLSAGNRPVSEFDDNEKLITGAFPWIFPFGKCGRVDAARRKLLVSQFDNRIEPTLIFLLFNQMQRHRVTHNIARSTPDSLYSILRFCGNGYACKRLCLSQQRSKIHCHTTRVAGPWD